MSQLDTTFQKCQKCFWLSQKAWQPFPSAKPSTIPSAEPQHQPARHQNAMHEFLQLFFSSIVQKQTRPGFFWDGPLFQMKISPDTPNYSTHFPKSKAQVLRSNSFHDSFILCEGPSMQVQNRTHHNGEIQMRIVELKMGKYNRKIHVRLLVRLHPTFHPANTWSWFLFLSPQSPRDMLCDTGQT